MYLKRVKICFLYIFFFNLEFEAIHWIGQKNSLKWYGTPADITVDSLFYASTFNSASQPFPIKSR